MATVSGSAMGFFKGKLGNAISYQLNGKNVVRSLTGKSAKNKRGSVLQNANRSKFTKMQYFLQPILDFIRVGFNMEAHSRQMSAHNVAKSYNMLHAFNAEGEIDYSKVLVSFGNLASSLSAQVEVDDIGLHFSWTNPVDNSRMHRSDQVMLLAYCPNDNSAEMILSGARRGAEKESLELWKDKTPLLYHIWIAFISDDRQEISMSTYLGEITF